jgi:hypothetical protein
MSVSSGSQHRAHLNDVLAVSFSLKRRNECLVGISKGAECVKQLGATRGPQAMDHEIATFVARDGHPIGVQSEFRGNAYHLTVAAVEDAGPSMSSCSTSDVCTLRWALCVTSFS